MGCGAYKVGARAATGRWAGGGRPSLRWAQPSWPDGRGAAFLRPRAELPAMRHRLPPELGLVSFLAHRLFWRPCLACELPYALAEMGEALGAIPPVDIQRGPHLLCPLGLSLQTIADHLPKLFPRPAAAI